MKRIFCILTCSLAVALAGCSMDYKKAFIGKWLAGKTFGENNIVITFTPDDRITIVIDDNTIKGTYLFQNDCLILTFPHSTITYKIIRVRDDTILIRSSDGVRIRWKRLE